MKKLFDISKIIKQSKTFFIAGHIKTDGDSLGSALALTSVLTRLGKKASVYYNDDVPDFLKFLKGSNLIKRSVMKTDVFDCAIILESFNFSRMGDIISRDQVKKIINIDHHLSHTNFGTVNYIVPSSSSVAELVFNILEYMEIKLTKDEAESLYTGILTDTGCFKYVNTTPSAHITCAKLMRYGLNADEIYEKIYEKKTINYLRLHGMALCSMKTIINNNVSYIILTRNMLNKSGAKDNDADNIINYTLEIDGIKIGCLFKEISNDITKISCRSVRGFNILEIMRTFGGGGHKNAAGCIINSGINNSIRIISPYFKRMF
ncbi:MAG: bifunctional oligoribonuclease/PAP phosphatase NrnA [Endomicrobium sp.]|nr:bifunctional oligoribonuclease/PAP phosphatase NrnA [Endomicrobium sp.]